jgi:hypothetical protein
MNHGRERERRDREESIEEREREGEGGNKYLIEGIVPLILIQSFQTYQLQHTNQTI